MGKFFGREPRYSREEIERQAQEAIDARLSLGRPPAEDWQPLEIRLDELDRAIVAHQAGGRVASAHRSPEPIRVAADVPVPTRPVSTGAPAGRRPVAASPAVD